MKKLKKILSVLLVMTIITSFMAVPVLAAESFTYEDKAKILYDLGLFRGVSQTEYKPNLGDSLIREEGAALVLRLFNLEEEANKMDETEANNLLKEKFKDADKISSWAVKIIAYSVKNGIINGRPDGNFAPQDPLLGKEFAKMILEQLGQSYNFHTACADLAAISDLTALEALKFNDKNLIRDDVVGISFATLKATYADGRTVISVLAENEDFKTKAINLGLIEIVKVVSVLYPVTITVGDNLDLPEKVDVQYSDGSKSKALVSWDKSKVRTNIPGEYKAIGTIDNYDGKIEIAVFVESDILEVESVTADNLKEIVVVYNQDVSENTAVANKDNYSLSNRKDIIDVDVYENTAILTVEDGIENQRKVKLKISGNILEEEKEIEFTFFDAELPEVVDFQITGPKKIQLTFTEPINKPGSSPSFNGVNITVKSGSSRISVNKSAITGEGTRVISVPLYSSFVDGREYEVTVEGFEDYAGYRNKIATFDFVYEKDETPPVATIDEATQEYVKVTFNKPVTGLTKDHFSHTFSAWTAMNITKGNTYGSEQVNYNDSVRTVYVWFYKDGKPASKAQERPIPEGETTFRILTKASGKVIKDDWGNEFEEEVFKIKVTADNKIPEVKEVVVTGEDEFTVEFTKKVTFEYDDNLEVLDENGKEIDGLNISITPDSSGKKFTVNLGKNLKGKVIIVNIKNVKDTTINTNKLDFYSITLEIDDKTPPVLTKVTYEVIKEKGKEVAWFLYAFFNESVDGDTALDSNNYYLRNGEIYTKLTEEAEFYAGDKIVKIALTSSQKGLINLNSTELFVTDVSDMSNNEIAPTSVVIKDIKASDNAPYIKKAVAVERDKIELTFNEELSSYDMDAFEVKLKNGDTITVSALEADLDDEGQTKLTLMLNEELAYNTSGDKIKIVEPRAVSNLFGVEPEVLEKVIEDNIKPEVIHEKPIVVGDNGKIVIRFTEALSSASNVKPLIPIDLKIVAKYDNRTLDEVTDYTVEVDNTHEVVRIDGEDIDVYGKLIVSIKSVSHTEVYKVSSRSNISYIRDIKGNIAKPFTDVVEIKGKDLLESAEQAELAAAIVAAETAVNELPEVVENAENASVAQDAIDAAISKINAVKALNNKYDTTAWDAVITAQQAIVDNMKALEEAIAAANAAIEGLPEAVENAENAAAAQNAIDAAKGKINAVLALSDEYDTNEWDAVISAQQVNVDIMKATEAVVKAENSKKLEDVNEAQQLVSALPDGEAKTSLQERIDKIKTAEVKTAAELEAALNNEIINKIIFKADITTDKHLYIKNANIVIDGKKNYEENYILKASNNVVKDELGRNTILTVEVANGVKISNLTIDASDANTGLDSEGKPKWDSLYALQVFNSTGVELNNLTLKGGDAGLLVNSSIVSINNIKTLGNEFGGIEVSKSSDPKIVAEPRLMIIGTCAYNDNPGTPNIWIAGRVIRDNWVDYVVGVYTELPMYDKNQLWIFKEEPGEQ